MTNWADAGLTVAISDANEYHQAGEPISELEALADAQTYLNTWRSMVVHDAHANGHTWATIGNALGITKQAAQQRYGHKNHWTAADTAAGLTPSMFSDR
jgi:hypothetical protein